MEHKKKIIENNLPPNIDWSSLVQGLEIGKGSFSQVFQFYNSNKHEEIYAVKLIKSDEETLDKIKEEIDFFEKNKEIPEIQKYLITYYGYVHFKQKFNNLKTENYALLFEMAQGTIVNLIKKRSKSLSFNEIIDMSESVSNVLYAFQKKKIAHRDIKPANILYFEDKDKTIFKIIDFGEVKLQVENQGTIKGTPLYFAPEENYLYMKNEDFLKEQYNPFKSDVYSFALTIIFAALENLPFTKNQNALPVEGERLKSCMKRIEERFKDPFKENIGPYDNLLQESVNKIIENFKGNRGLKDFKKLLLNMLEYNPNNRCDWETVKKTIKKIKEKNKVFSCEQCSKKDKEIEQLKKEIAHKNQCLQILAERTSRILKELDHEKNSRCTAETNLSEILSKDSFVCQEQIIEKEKEKVVEKPIIEEKIIIEEKKEEPQEDKKMISKLNLIMDALLSNKKEEILIDENKLIEIPINDKTDIIVIFDL